jgi:hypothetical protein
MPATTTGTTTTFQIKADIYTALLTTTDPSLIGDLSMKTLTDMISVGGDAVLHGGQFALYDTGEVKFMAHCA